MYYLKGDFKITTLHVYGEFTPIQALIQEIQGGPRVNLASASEHFPEIDRQIRVAKEIIGSIRHSLPFNTVPKLFMIHLVFQAIKIPNEFTVKGGISDTISSTKIMTGESMHYKKYLGLQIGHYCQLHEEDTSHNINQPRTKGAICMGPRGNIQGRFKFMSLRSMKNYKAILGYYPNA